jgi:hypothetical protein
MRFAIAAILLFAFNAQAELPYLDSDFGCMNRSDADRYIRDYSIDVASFGGLELCDGSKDTKKLLNDIYLVEKAQFEAAGEHKFIKGYVARDNYYAWMKGETYGVRRGHDIPYATAYNSGGQFTMQDGWATLSTLGRVGTIIHEARHTDGYRHYSCNSGPYAGSGVSGCDTSYAQGGSHAVEMEYYARVVLEAKNLHPVYKSMARLMALGRSNFVFNTMPMQKREAVLAKNERKILLVDGNDMAEREVPLAEAGSKLKRTSFGASLVKGQKSIAVDLYGISALGIGLADDYSYYKLFQSPRDGVPGGVADTEEVDSGVLRYFVAMDAQGKVYSYNFPQGSWHLASAASAARVFVTRAPNGQDGLFAVTADGSVLPYDLRARRFGAPLAQKWQSDIAAYAKMGTRALKLTSSGEVLDANTGEAVAPFDSERFTDLVNVPMYDAFEVVR